MIHLAERSLWSTESFRSFLALFAGSAEESSVVKRCTSPAGCGDRVASSQGQDVPGVRVLSAFCFQASGSPYETVRDHSLDPRD